MDGHNQGNFCLRLGSFSLIFKIGQGKPLPSTQKLHTWGKSCKLISQEVPDDCAFAELLLQLLTKH